MGIYEQKIELLGFLHVTSVMLHLHVTSVMLQNIQNKFSSIWNPSYGLKNLQRFARWKWADVSIKTLMKFYDNIIDTLLDDDMIPLYIKSIFQIPVTGINCGLQCKYIPIKKHMDSYHSIKLPVSPLNCSSVAKIKSILWCYFTSNINKENMAWSKCQNKDGVHQTIFIDNFPEHFFLLFERNQYQFQTLYGYLVNTRIKCEESLNLSFCLMVDICETPHNYTLVIFSCLFAWKKRRLIYYVCF